MSKVVLPPVTGSYNFSQINDNFSQISYALDSGVLWRDNPSGTPNEMLSDLDMNGHHIYNLPTPVLGHEPVRLEEIQGIQADASEAAESAAQAAAAAQAAVVVSQNALSIAQEAEETANGIDGKAQAALDASAVAVSTSANAEAVANAAAATANGIAATANMALITAEQANTTAQLAQAAVAGKMDVTGGTMSGALVISTPANQLRMKFNADNTGYGTIFRSDPTTFSIRTTALDDAGGADTAARPLSIDLATSMVTIPSATINGGIPWTSVNFNPTTKQDALGFTPVQQGGGVNQSPNKLYLGWAAVGNPGVRATVDGTDVGLLMSDANLTAHIASLSTLNAIGSYAFGQNNFPVTLSPGEIVDGSGLSFSGVSASSSTFFIGVWRCMGYCISGDKTLFLRVS